MKLQDYKKAAKELMLKTGCSKIKVVAVKESDLKKAIKEMVASLAGVDWSSFSALALDVFAELECVFLEDEEAPETEETEQKPKSKKKGKVVSMKKEDTKGMKDAAADLIDVLNFDKNMIDKFNDISFKKGLIEIQDMADEINEPYEADNGKMTTPDDKPEMFKPGTIAFFEANGIKVKWNEEEAPEVKPKSKKKDDKPAAGKKPDSDKVTAKKVAKYEMINAVKDCFEKGKFTRKEIIAKVSKELPHLNTSTIGTLVSDSKNPKYNKYDSLVVQDEEGILSFS